MRRTNSSLHYATHDTRLTHGHRKLHPVEDFEMCLMPDFEMLRLTCDFKTLRLTPARRQPGETFRNQASGARFQNVIFCDHASDVQYESGYVGGKVEVKPGNLIEI